MMEFILWLIFIKIVIKNICDNNDNDNDNNNDNDNGTKQYGK